MTDKKQIWWIGPALALITMACAIAKQTPQSTEFAQLAFEIQTATPTVSVLFSAPTATVDPNATLTPTPTATLTQTVSLTATFTPEATLTPPTAQPPAEVEAAPPAEPAPPPAPTVLLVEPLSGGDWDFEAGFTPWRNPFGDSCDGSGLANGWNAFTTRDAHGSSCMNQTVWQGNVHSGESAQEITFGFVGSTAGIFKTAPTIPGHQYTVEAFMKREFSPAKVEMSLGLDVTGGVNWEAETVQWFPWREDLDDQWARTEETITATGETMTVFIKGVHPYAEPGGAMRLDSISVVDKGPGE